MERNVDSGGREAKRQKGCGRRVRVADHCVFMYVYKTNDRQCDVL